MTTKLTILSTGGTIGMRIGAGAGAALVEPIDFLAMLADSIPGISVSVHAVFSKPSTGLALRDVVQLAALAEGYALAGDAVVITHGTDTLEETAFALELLSRASEPIVLTGAMRAADSIGYDGAANLIAACRVAVDEEARGKGVLVVLDDEIHWGPLVRKIHASRVHAFSSAPLGPVGWVSEGRPRFFLAPTRRIKRLQFGGREPVVPLIEVGQAGDQALLRNLLETEGDGLVLSLPGGGHIDEKALPILDEISRLRPTVFASRTGGGEVLFRSYAYPGGDMDLVARGLIPASFLDARKARIALSVLCSNGASHDEVRDFFRGL